MIARQPIFCSLPVCWLFLCQQFMRWLIGVQWIIRCLVIPIFFARRLTFRCLTVRSLTFRRFVINGFIVSCLVIIGWIMANDQNLMAQNRKSLFYFGQTNYTPPKNYGFWGYSRSEQSNSIAPATVIDETDQIQSDISNNQSYFIPQTSASQQRYSENLVPPPNGTFSEDGTLPLNENLSDIKASVKHETVKSHSLPDSPLNANLNGTDAQPFDKKMMIQTKSANSYESDLAEETNTQAERNIVIPPTGLKTDEELLFYLNQEKEQPKIAESNAVSDFMLTSVRASRSSFFQRLDFDISYVPDTKNDRAGLTDLNLSATFAVPCPTVDSPLLFKPLFSWTQMNLPRSVEEKLGQQLHLYSPGLEAQYLLPISESILLNFDTKIQWSSDLKANDSRMLRITGYGAGIWKMGPQAELILGAQYTDVSEINILPIAGIIWMPSEDFYFNAFFPRPKIAKRLDSFQCLNRYPVKSASDYWLYLAGEFDGDQWIFQTKEKSVNADGSYGSTALLKYYDARCYAGLERRTADQLDWALEGGLVFARHLNISGRNYNPNFSYEFDPKATGFARLKIMY